MLNIFKYLGVSVVVLFASVKAFADDSISMTLTMQNNLNMPLVLMPVILPDEGVGTWKNNAFFKGYIPKGTTTDTQYAVTQSNVQMAMSSFMTLNSSNPCGVMTMMFKAPGFPLVATATSTMNKNDNSCKLDQKISGNNFIVTLTVAPSMTSTKSKNNPNAG